MAETAAPTPSQTYEASCHCGTIRFSATVSPPLAEGHEVTCCNCSICVCNGYLLVYLPDEQVKFHSGENEAKARLILCGYRFGERIEHCFCPKCGTSVYAYSIKPGLYEGFKAVNVRTFKDIDIDALKLKKVDGKSV